MFFTKSIVIFITFLLALVSAAPVKRCRPISTSSAATSSSTKPAQASAPVINAVASPTKSSQPSPSATKAPAGSTSNNGALSALFPVKPLSSWTTSPLSKDAVPLSDATLNPKNLLKALSHDYVTGPEGRKSMKAHYPKGSNAPSNSPQGGVSFYAPGMKEVDLTTAKEATFGYSVYFPEGFNFVLGGKLPGIYGGNSEAEAIGCSGGRRSTTCFSARLMWRTKGEGEFYTYLPPFTDSRFAANKKQCNVAPVSDCNPVYGASIGRGSFGFATGQWTTVSERVKLNTPGKADGELELFANGKSVVNIGGLILRDSAEGRMRGIQMQTFFGGSHPQFSTPKDQDVYFSDFSVAITEKL